MTVTDASYERVNATDDWFDVLIEGTKVGQVFKTKKGWLGTALNAPHKRLGPARLMKDAGNLVVGQWETFPVAQ